MKKNLVTNNSQTVIEQSLDGTYKKSSIIKYMAKNEYNSKMKEILSIYDKTKEQLGILERKVESVLSTHEHMFLSAYREQMNEVQNEIEILKTKFHPETIKKKRQDKVRILEEERNYFLQEALRLDKIFKSNSQKIDKLKEKISILNEEKGFLEGFVMKTKNKKNRLSIASFQKNQNYVQQEEPKDFFITKTDQIQHQKKENDELFLKDKEQNLKAEIKSYETAIQHYSQQSYKTSNLSQRILKFKESFEFIKMKVKEKNPIKKFKYDIQIEDFKFYELKEIVKQFLMNKEIFSEFLTFIQKELILHETSKNNSQKTTKSYVTIPNIRI